MITNSPMALITKAYWILSSTYEGRLPEEITTRDAILTTTTSLKHLDPTRLVARKLMEIETAIIQGNPIQDKAAQNAS